MRVEKASSSIPAIEDITKVAWGTQLSEWISNIVPPKYGSVSFDKFDGTSDPNEHLLQFKIVVFPTPIPTGIVNEMMCKLFAQSLKGLTLRWYSNQQPQSIDSFADLSDVFITNYAIDIESGKTTKDLWGVVQRVGEPLKSYIDRFNVALSKITGLDDGAAREALKKGLLHKSKFKDSICSDYPKSIRSALNRAKGFIDLEEEDLQIEWELARSREQNRDPANRQTRQDWRDRSRLMRRESNQDDRSRKEYKRPLSPPTWALHGRLQSFKGRNS
ncbi:hypothetical protein L484_025767 [Morus notabilis]|uniref:Retrotransposon gag domain-containing protein n=1 Tax=Morus notabilis TaxID=981085 RepID=W9RC40_9ROSA|nr:uncharacterized protein LOC21408449 [Morus notabilis]EXB67285.1 hypothetical protein L484_025767 [Morus notabilis]